MYQPRLASPQVGARALWLAVARRPTKQSFARLETENYRRHVLLKEYPGSRQYTFENGRFGKQTAVAVFMICRQVGRLETVLTRSGPDRLVGIIDRVLATKISSAS
jgi:hypothetical protein